MNRETNNLVFHDHKVVIMTACKAGNTSIKQALHDGGIARANPRGRYFGFDHWSAAQCAASDYHRIAIIRHPAARLVSTWYAKLIVGNKGGKVTDILKKHGDVMSFGMKLKPFIKAVFEIQDTKADPHLRSQCFDRFHDGKYLPDQVFRLEDPSSEWWPLVREHLPELKPTMPHENKSEAHDWAKVLTEDDRRMISIRYQSDLALGGYKLR